MSFAVAPIAALAANAPPTQTNTKTAFEDSVLQKGSIGFLGKGLLWGFNAIVVAIGSLAAGLVDLAGSVFDIALEFSFSTLRENQIIRAGWTISRDIANIFFVLFILIIAIATILGVQSYGAKSLLAKLIVVAILINFSLVIGYTIIDATNILGLQFYEKIVDKDSARPASVSQRIIAGTKLSNVFNVNMPEDTITGDLKQMGKGIAITLGVAGAVAACLWLGPVVAAGCGWKAFWIAVVGGGGLGSLGWAKITGDDIGSAVQFFFLAGSMVIFLVAVMLVLVAGAIFVIMRSVMLVLLLVLAPIAFVSYVLPIAEKKLWQPWWETFLNQAFFLPAFMFLLYISIGWLNQIGKDVTSGILMYNPPAVAATLTGTIMIILALLLARKMGIYFADSVLAYSTMAKKWVTRATGGVALRNTVGRLGGLMQQSPAIQSSVFGARMSKIMTKAGARLPGGSYEDLQREKAESTMKKADSEWAKDFMGLDTPGRVVMLSKMNDKQKDGLRENLKKISPDAGEQMFNNAMRLHFGEAELGKVDLESWKRSDQAAQKNLMPYSPEVTEQILRSFPDEDARAKWMLGLTAENKNKAQGVMDTKFNTTERAKYNKAERRQEMRGKELAGGDEFDKFINTLPVDQDSNYLDSADDRQKLLWLESVNKIADPVAHAAKLQRYQNIIQTKLSQEDQDKFYRETLRRASVPTILSYVQTLPDAVSKEKVIGSVSPVQQAQLWMSDRPMRKIVGTAIGKQPADTQKDFHSALAREIDRKTADDIADVFSELHEETKSVVIHGNIDRNIEIIASLDKAGKSADVKEFADNIKSAGLTTQYVKKLNPVQKVRYIDNVDLAHPDFVEKVGDEIKNTSARDLTAKLSADILANKQLREALLKKGSLTQFATLAADTPNKQAIVKEMLTTDDAGNALSPGAILNNIKTKNKELGEQIEALRKRQAQSLIPVVREFLAAIFGEK